MSRLRPLVAVSVYNLQTTDGHPEEHCPYREPLTTLDSLELGCPAMQSILFHFQAIMTMRYMPEDEELEDKDAQEREKRKEEEKALEEALEEDDEMDI